MESGNPCQDELRPIVFRVVLFPEVSVYYQDDRLMDLDQLCRRLNETDLIPSQQALLPDLPNVTARLTACGVTNVFQLRATLKTAKKLHDLAEKTGIDPAYLSLLRRTVEGWFPKPPKWNAFSLLPTEAVATLARLGLDTTEDFFTAFRKNAKDLEKRTGLDAETLGRFFGLADLSRIQWVSPTFAQALAAAGYDRASKVAEAEAETLAQALEDVNRGKTFYGGKIGLRDIRRLILAASHVPRSGG